MSRPTTSLSDRFWRKVVKTDGCWKWTGAIKDNGYGVIGEGTRGGRTLRVSRVSYELAFGPIPDGLHVCHRCDNRACVRPDHLFLGTRFENMQDAKAKGRSVAPPLHAGEHQHLAKLTVDSVRSARELASAGLTHSEIAQRLGVSRSAVSRAVSGKTWRCVCA